MTEEVVSLAQRIESAPKSVACPCCAGTGKVDLRPMARRAAERTVVTEQGCWELTGGKGAYPKIMEKALSLAVHHLGYRLWVGIPTIGMTLHSCDNGRCWNPDHLRDGGALENNRDRRQRYQTYGRPGVRNHFAKLTEEQVATIRSSRDGDVMRLRTARQLAELFGVSTHTVYRAAHGQTHQADTRQKPPPRPHWSKRGVAPEIPAPPPGTGFKPGEQHANAKLSDEQVAAIRADSRSSSQIAVEYEVNPGTIRKIKRGERR